MGEYTIAWLEASCLFSCSHDNGRHTVAGIEGITDPGFPVGSRFKYAFQTADLRSGADQGADGSALQFIRSRGRKLPKFCLRLHGSFENNIL